MGTREVTREPTRGLVRSIDEARESCHTEQPSSPTQIQGRRLTFPQYIEELRSYNNR